MPTMSYRQAECRTQLFSRPFNMIAIMKKTYRSLIVLAAAMFVFGCTDVIENAQSDYSFRLEVSTDDVTITKATAAGDDAFNENLIRTVDYFLYPKGATGSNAVYVGRIAPNAKSTTTIGADITAVFTTLFPADGSKCDVYVIANLPEGTAIPTTTTIAGLKAIAITTSFKDKAVQDSFVMTAQGEIQRSGSKATGSVSLKRVASKFSLQAAAVDKFIEDRPGTEPDITWTPMPENMTVVMKNVAGKSNVEGAASAAASLGDYKSRKFTKMTGTGSTYTEGVSPDVKTFTKYAADSVWYSYPRAWTDASKATSLLITLPWKRPLDPADPSQGDKYQKCYYKVLLNEDEIGSNKWYNVVAELKVLGSFYEDSPTLVLPDDLDYTVLDWRDGIAGSLFNTDAAVKDAGYLTVSSNSYLLDNVNTIAIPYSSSEECSVNCSCTYQRYNSSSKTWVPTTLETSKYTCTCSDGFINLTHELKNTIPDFRPFTVDDFDLSEFVFTIELYHTDDKAHYCETITVRQTPALVIDYITNTRDNSSATKYTTFVNANKSQASSPGAWWNVSNRALGGNMYQVKVSRTDDYVIGDPRTTTPYSYKDLGLEGYNNLGMTGTDTKPTDGTATPTSATAPAFYKDGTHYANPTGHTRELMYYYPTHTESEYANMISPKFRFASEQANCNGYYSSLKQVQWRCATYQEYGYPAGRWRVPTAAELKYVGTLCATGVIPYIFASSTAYYWANDGVYKYEPTDGTVTKVTTQKATSYPSEVGGFSRCVYDEWYWEQSDYGPLTATSTPNYENFVWGDMPRENFK